jgi:hypothetical protein
MALPKDITGQKFDLLTAIKPTGKKINRKHIWLCRCACHHAVVPHKTVYQRVYVNRWTLEKALKTPLTRTKQKKDK